MGRGLSARLAQKLFAVLDPSHKDCVYTTVQLARNFSKPNYKSLPWFLEYPEGKFAAQDELRHNAAVAERTARINSKAIVPHVPQISKEGIQVPSVPGTSDTNPGKNMEAETQFSQPSNQDENTTSHIGKKRSELSIVSANKDMFEIIKEAELTFIFVEHE